MTIHIEIALCLAPREVQTWTQAVPEGTTVAQACGQAVQRWHNDADVAPQALAERLAVNGDWQWGVWGRVLPPEHVLQNGDRLEAYRPLLVDPKVARRERFAKQGVRGAGLFSKRRDNAKPGY